MAASAQAKIELSGLEKTAVLLMAIGEDAGSILLKNLPREQVLRIISAVSSFGTIRRSEIDTVLQEAWTLAKQRQGELRGNPDYLRRFLEGAFGSDEAASLLISEPEPDSRPTSIASLDKADSKRLVRLLRAEHPQAVAILLTQMRRPQASELLSSLPASMRADVALRMARLEQIPMHVVEKVAGAIQSRLGQPATASQEQYLGTRAIADLVNSMDPAVAEETLEAIGGSDPDLANIVRDLLFVFEDLVNLDSKSIREIVSRVDRRVLTVALKGTSDRLKDHILKTMSQRGAALLREDMDAMGPIKIKEVMDAQKEVLAVLRRLEADGTISTRGGEQQYVV
jgi:flagellar motor switch protein FliG